MGDHGTLIVGAGQAAFQLAHSLRAEGYDQPIRILGDELHVPYQRPPLSKAYMDQAFGGSLAFQAAERYVDRDVELLLGHRAVALDRERRVVHTEDGQIFPYSHLVFATGTRNRTLADVCPGAEGALDLRTVDDAAAIRARLPNSRAVIVVGGGFLGLEFAAVAAKTGLEVTVVETAGTLMGRAVSPLVGAAFRRLHEAAGIRFLLLTTVAGLRPTADGRSEVTTTTGESLIADLVVSSIGVIPNTTVAADAGLTVRNGIVVDEQLFTDDPAVSAIGDCASFPSPFSDEHVRIESVQNATDQARYLAGRLMGQPGRYQALPWFWSDQGGVKLQIAGLAGAADETAVRGDAESLSFSVYRFRAGHLVAVESVARPKDHMTARRLLATRVPVTPEQARDENLDLKVLLPTAPPAAAVPR
jgi:3-phenylpropionate/trans-cinnamate dioxygenase ferredoxin reductase subunit